MKNIILLGVAGWVVYELYKMHTLNSTLAAMKNDVANLKTKISSISSSKSGNSAVPACSNVKNAPAACTTNTWGFTSFVGQPVFTEIISPDNPDALSEHPTSYNNIFRKKAVAFNQNNSLPFTGWK